MMSNPPGPTLLGVDVFFVGTILSGIAAMAVLFAIYTAISVRDPMARRVKALNQRRDELKAGIVAGPRSASASSARAKRPTGCVPRWRG